MEGETDKVNIGNDVNQGEAAPDELSEADVEKVAGSAIDTFKENK
jgi:hypothetical protein